MNDKLEWKQGASNGIIKAVSTKYPPHDDGSNRCYRVCYGVANNPRFVIAFAPFIREGIYTCETIEEGKAWCENHDREVSLEEARNCQ